VKEMLNKKFDTLTLDFNQFTEILSSDNYCSQVSANYLNAYMLQTVFKVRDVHTHSFFNDIIKKICLFKEIPIGSKLDAFLFIGFTQGSVSIIHKDDYDVFLYGLYGKTLYIVEKENYVLDQGDLLHIKKRNLHQGLGLTPRIILSLGLRNDI
jgi:ribosomal protein L16 Arg81 hydroxylase